jgi:hypothetical protein
MRGYALFVTAILVVPSSLSAQSDEIPTLDIRPVCRGIASQSSDPGVAQGGQAETFRQCLESEQGVHEQLKKVWASFSAADKKHCVTLAKTGGESSNTELLTCLEMARDVRALHSRPAASSEGVKTSTTSALQSPPPISPSLPSPSSAVPKVAGDEPTKEDALAVKASEALARVKLADAEVAINSAKEEVGRARAEAEQAKAEAQKAKADAQAARDAEVLAQRKLADAEAAHATAEEACSSPAEPGLAGRLREWFKRPRTIKNP